MRLGGFLCLGGTELANDIRTLAYIKTACLPGWDVFQTCECEAYGHPMCQDVAIPGLWDDGVWDDGVWSDAGETFCTPVEDPAPWYVASDPRSADFMGLMLDEVRLLSPFSRSVTPLVGVGSSLGSLRLGHRIVAAEGLMVAATCEGMDYGERWLHEALRGAVCAGGCVPDALHIATNCTADGIRELRSVGLVDGPVFSDATTPFECTTQRVAFQFASEMPYLFWPAVTLINTTMSAGGQSCGLITVPTWPSDVTTRIVLQAPDTGDGTGIEVTVTPTDEDTCPDTGHSPCAGFTVPVLPAGTRLTIDGRTRRVTRRDPSLKQDVNGLSLLDFQGPFDWLDIAPCAKACLCVELGAGSDDMQVLVQTFAREL